MSAKTPDTNSLAGINTLNSTPDAKSTGSGFIQQINRLSEQEAIAQGYTVIKTAQDLDNIRNDLDGKYILMNDIDLSGFDWNPIGEVDSNGIKQGFTGVLDGNGYTISNLTINRPDEDYVGLFVCIGDPNTMSGGEVRNLGIEAADIVANYCVGGLAGGSVGTITNCYVTGDVTGNENAGGLVGVNSGIITNSYAAAVSVMGNPDASGGLVGYNVGTISNSYASGSITGSTRVGGLVGDNYGGTITNCYADGNVNGDRFYIGGLAGRNRERGIITNSYATGLVQGRIETGGLVGDNYGGAVQNSNWNTDTTGQSAAVGSSTGTESNNKGLTTAEMQNPTNWQGWDTSIWDFSTYPPTFKMYTPVGGGSTGGGDVQIPGAVRLQIGSDSSSTSAIYVDTSFDLGAFDVDFSSADSCAAAIEDIDEVLSRINTKRSEFGAVINRLSSILESQTTTIQNFTVGGFCEESDSPADLLCAPCPIPKPPRVNSLVVDRVALPFPVMPFPTQPSPSWGGS